MSNIEYNRMAVRKFFINIITLVNKNTYKKKKDKLNKMYINCTNRKTKEEEKGKKKLEKNNIMYFIQLIRFIFLSFILFMSNFYLSFLLFFYLVAVTKKNFKLISPPSPVSCFSLFLSG